MGMALAGGHSTNAARPQTIKGVSMRPVHTDDVAAPPPPPHRAVFIDKDGTLVEDVPFNVDPARVRFTTGAVEGLRLLAAEGFLLVVVTNQPGLARRLFTRADFARLQSALTAMLRAEGIALAGIYACPHAPSVGPVSACLCRKPAPGLLHQAARAHRIDLARSWMVGDILDDVEAGRRAGCRTVMLDVGHETVWRRSPLRHPHIMAMDLLDAARRITAAEHGDGTPHPPRAVVAS
jgi:histidinol-phosphate phosphatase family protein